MIYIDIHTHKKNENPDIFSIQNIYPDELKNNINHLCSTAIHPWFADNKTYKKEIKAIEKNIYKKNIIAIGETGLDKNKPNFEFQKRIFTHQIKIANYLKKPIIIHCVRAYYEIISIIKKNQITVPVIFHAFGGNNQIAKILIQKNFYLSFGKILFNKNAKATKIFPNLPENRIFFETDDSAYEIPEIYEKAAELKRININKLKIKTIENFNNSFALF